MSKEEMYYYQKGVKKKKMNVSMEWERRGMNRCEEKMNGRMNWLRVPKGGKWIDSKEGMNERMNWLGILKGHCGL